ncbi:DUF4407 domain-containing protein [Pedobacter sp.]|uniref:DUF4407 domain-containing protein n=1 Tax=Pedobacter sp. TaxID=1411316 RepID=UPI00396C615F
MRRFQRWWIKFGCFLTGHDFFLLSSCSEVAIRKVKKYTAALIIISIIWAFVGYSFCSRYIKLDPYESILGALVACLVVIQIERQILMVDKSNKWTAWMRAGIALLMAIIGSLVVDQIIFKDDVEKAKMESNQRKVNKLLPLRSAQLSSQLKEIDSIINLKENQREILLKEINDKPLISFVETSVSKTPIVSNSNDSVKTKSNRLTFANTKTINKRSISNPKIAQLQPLDAQIESLRKEKAKKDATLLTLQSVLEKEVGEKVGFLDELTLLIEILSNSIIATAVYCIWFLLFLFLELLILVSKRNDIDSDYEQAIQHQMALHNKKIQLLMSQK